MISPDLTPWQAGRLLLSTVFGSELLRCLPLRSHLTQLGKLLRRIVKTLRSKRISDHWKERVMPIYAGHLLRDSLIMLILLTLAVSPLILGLWWVTGSTEALIALSADPWVLIGITAISISYLFLRSRRRV